MHESRVVAPAKKSEQMQSRIHVGGECFAKIGIEIGESRAVDDQVERFRKACLRGFIHAEARLADIAFHNLDFLLQKSTQPTAVALLQAIKRRRFLDDFFEPALRGSSAIAADK